jgi:hypothetical protein
MKFETNLLSDSELDAVAGGMWNDPERTLMVQREYASAIAAAKGLGDTPGGLYVDNTATTERAGWNHF